jgi:Zn-dependent protease with chaperone function
MNTLLFVNLGALEMGILLIVLIIGTIPFILAIGSIIDLLKRDFTDKSTDKILLILLILFAPFIGSLVYLFLLRKNYPFKNHYEKIRI